MPVNKEGPGDVYSEVIVPDAECMPKKTGMFTVITTTTDKGKIYSLYWVPSHMPNRECPGSNTGIDSYSIYWCKKTYGFRCKVGFRHFFFVNEGIGLTLKLPKNEWMDGKMEKIEKGGITKESEDMRRKDDNPPETNLH